MEERLSSEQRSLLLRSPVDKGWWASAGRRRAARASARILVVALLEVLWQLQWVKTEKPDTWPSAWVSQTGFQHALDTYDRADIDALARDRGLLDVSMIGIGFAILRYYERVRAHGRDEGDPDLGYAAISTRLPLDVDRIREPAKITWRAGHTKHDQSPEEVARREQLMKDLHLPEDLAPWHEDAGRVASP
jgi:hypothetical protein